MTEHPEWPAAAMDEAREAAVPDAPALRAFLKSNVTVVAPGETLVVRAPDLMPSQLREFSEVMNRPEPDGTPWLPFRTVVVPGEALGVVSETDLRTALRDLVREEIKAELMSSRASSA